MFDLLIPSQLRTKQAKWKAVIARPEARIVEARASVIHIASVARLFDPKAPDAQLRA